MKNKYWAAGLCLLILMLCLVSACGGGATTTASISEILGRWSNTGSVKYDMAVTTTGTETVTVTIWQKNKKMREDMTLQGLSTTLLFDMDTGIMYTYMPYLNMATKSNFTPSALPQGSVSDTSIILQYNPKIIDTETIDGKSCTVISYTMGGSSTKAWIWTDKGFPIKIEMTSGGSKTTIEYKNIDFSDIPDSTFQLPADVKISQM